MWGCHLLPLALSVGNLTTAVPKVGESGGGCVCVCTCISRVSNQNGVSLLYIMLEIHHSGREPSISLWMCVCA